MLGWKTKNSIIGRLRLWAIVLLMLSVHCALAENATLLHKKNQLQSITKQINQVKQNIQNFQTEKASLQSTLKTIETNIGTLSSTLRKTSTKLIQQKTSLSLSQKQLAIYRQKLEIQKQLLAQQVKAAYFLGQQPFLKVLLNQEKPAQLARYLEYYKYLSQARLSVIADMKQTMSNITHTSNRILKQTEKLTAIQQQQQQQHNALQNQHEQRQQLLSKTELAIQNKTELLNKLISDKRALENVIQTLSQSTAFGYFPGASFIQMKGKLHWPLNHAKILESFNQPIAYGHLHSSGILLATHLGENVYAIFPGKVIFADWLHGFGLMVILQHSNGYLSLYARNQSLEVKTGDTVEAGQVIATSGNSGGYQTPALYFEIRKNSTPVNPLLWLRKA